MSPVVRWKTASGAEIGNPLGCCFVEGIFSERNGRIKRTWEERVF